MPGGLSWTEEQLKAALEQGNVYIAGEPAQATVAPNLPAMPQVIKVSPSRPITYGQYRSRLEQEYAQWLDVEVYDGRLTRWWYEPIRLRLAQQTTLTPDFLIERKVGERLEFHETKGWKREDAMVKLKVAAHMYSIFQFFLVTRKNRTWMWQEVPML